jgi:hypothetical protein
LVKDGVEGELEKMGDGKVEPLSYHTKGEFLLEIVEVVYLVKSFVFFILESFQICRNFFIVG